MFEIIIKAIVEFFPLIVFFLCYKFYNINVATVGLMISTMISICVSKYYGVKMNRMAILATIIVFIFGGLTLYLQDSTFIKMKPTIFNIIMGVVLLYNRKNLNNPSSILHDTIPFLILLPPKVINNVVLCWISYFFGVAALNEFLWRNFTEEAWVNFKLVGFPIIGIIFITLNFVLLRKFLFVFKK